MPNIIPPKDETYDSADTVGDVVRIGLLKENKPQRWLAEQLGVSQQTVSSWVSNRFLPSKEQLSQISMALNVPLDELQKFHKSTRSEPKLQVTPEGHLWRVAMNSVVDFDCMTEMMRAYKDYQERLKKE